MLSSINPGSVDSCSSFAGRLLEITTQYRFNQTYEEKFNIESTSVTICFSCDA